MASPRECNFFFLWFIFTIESQFDLFSLSFRRGIVDRTIVFWKRKLDGSRGGETGTVWAGGGHL